MKSFRLIYEASVMDLIRIYFIASIIIIWLLIYNSPVRFYGKIYLFSIWLMC